MERQPDLYDIQLCTPQRFLTVPIKSEDQYILVIAFSGYGRYKMLSQTYNFDVGDIILSPPGCDISFSCDETPATPIAILRFPQCYCPWRNCEQPISQWLDKYLSPNNLPSVLHYETRAIEELKSIFHILYEEHSAKRSGGNAMNGILLSALLGQLARTYHFEQNTNCEGKKLPRGAELIERVKKIISTEFQEPLTLEKTALRCYVTSAYLSGLFHQKSGLTFTRYLNLTRINHARQLLLDTDELVVDIAISCGFSSSQHFNLTFKTLTGFTPLEFRQKFKPQI